jgi:hypothetical protein
MRYLGLALFAEGPTDHQFLRPLLHRVANELCVAFAREIVEVGEVLELHSPARVKDSDWATRIVEGAHDAWGGFNVLFIHTDGGGDPESAARERVLPAVRLTAAKPEWEGVRIVAVVPVREVEAWVLADGDALRASFGTMLDDSRLGLPAHRRGVEAIADPKQVLAQAYTKVVGRASRKRNAANLLGVLGERVRFSCLRDVPAFVSLESTFRTALTELGYLQRTT